MTRQYILKKLIRNKKYVMSSIKKHIQYEGYFNCAPYAFHSVIINEIANLSVTKKSINLVKTLCDQTDYSIVCNRDPQIWSI